MQLIRNRASLLWRRAASHRNGRHYFYILTPLFLFARSLIRFPPLQQLSSGGGRPQPPTYCYSIYDCGRRTLGLIDKLAPYIPPLDFDRRPPIPHRPQTPSPIHPSADEREPGEGGAKLPPLSPSASRNIIPVIWLKFAMFDRRNIKRDWKFLLFYWREGER